MYLLCNAAFRGSGKSTIQEFNLFWFVNETKQIGIEVTYNDDQAHLWMGGKVSDDRTFEQSVAIRMIHRILCWSTDDKTADAIVKDNRMISIISSVSEPILFAMRMVRRLVNAPSDTKIMLGVDELSKAGNAGYAPSEMLSQLTTDYLDKDASLFLSVSVYGAVDIKQFCTFSSRVLLFQALPPIWHNIQGIDPQSVHLLPMALQPFVDERKRINLPYDSAARLVYSRISKLIQYTAGHPRRVQKLLSALAPFDSIVPPSLMSDLERRGDKGPGETFASLLGAWLDANEKKVKVDLTENGPFPESIDSLVNDLYGPSLSQKDFDKSVVRVVEDLAVDCAKRFVLNTPSVSPDHRHRATLAGSVEGYTHILTTEDRFSIGFVPMEVLRTLDDDFEWGPCGSALVKLKDSVRSYLNYLPNVGKGRNAGKGLDDGKGRNAGKSLEAVVAASMLLYARANRKFPLSTLCAPTHCGKAIAGFDELRGGGDIEYIDSVDSFPPFTKPEFQLEASHVSDLIHQLAQDSAGAIIVPKETYNLLGDVFCLFRKRKEWVLVVVQVKDWFGDTAKGHQMVDQWRKHRSVTPDSTMQVLNRRKNVTETVHIVFTLFCANDIPKGIVCGANEGVGNILHMKDWLPTAAYACQNAVQLRSIFTQPVNSKRGKCS